MKRPVPYPGELMDAFRVPGGRRIVSSRPPGSLLPGEVLMPMYTDWPVKKQSSEMKKRSQKRSQKCVDMERASGSARR